MKNLLMTHMFWSTLHCIVELHLLELHREKHTKNTSAGVLQFLAASTNWIDRVMSAKQAYMLKKETV